jgi:two-component system response regulator NreC
VASPLRIAETHLPGDPAEPAIRVLLIDPHPAMRRNLRLLLEDEGIAVVCEADALIDVTPRIREHELDVLVLDLSFLAGADLSSIRWLSETAPAVPIVAVTLHEQPGFARAALRAGAHAVVLKDTADPALARAVRAAC